jgi:hypothetical protein
VQLDADIIQCTRSLWISEDALVAFITALTKLEEDRTGEAFLEGMSPNELHLRVAVIDTAGHVKLFVHLSKEQLLVGSKYSVSTEFAIDPSSLSRLVIEIDQLRISSL